MRTRKVYSCEKCGEICGYRKKFCSDACRSQIMNLVGQVYGRLTVLKIGVKNKSIRWICSCECGKEVTVQANNLRSGHTRSCGCYQDDLRGTHCVTHGMSNNPIYYIWSSMLARCHNPNNDKYHYYGGRGIYVCHSWHNFKNFFEDMGEPPVGLQLDRTDNSKGYCKENCKWVPKKINMRNRRNNRLVEYRGANITIAELSEITNLKDHLLRRRILKWGMTVEDAILSAKGARVVINKSKGAR